jgi:hypothetical protein
VSVFLVVGALLVYKIFISLFFFHVCLWMLFNFLFLYDCFLLFFFWSAFFFIHLNTTIYLMVLIIHGWIFLFLRIDYFTKYILIKFIYFLYVFFMVFIKYYEKNNTMCLQSQQHFASVPQCAVSWFYWILAQADKLFFICLNKTWFLYIIFAFNLIR